MTHSTFLFVLDALAVFRLTHLLTDDFIAKPIRDQLVRSAYGVEFVTCPWCVSIWMAAVVVALQALVPRQWVYAAAVLAFSAITGLLARFA